MCRSCRGPQFQCCVPTSDPPSVQVTKPVTCEVLACACLTLLSQFSEPPPTPHTLRLTANTGALIQRYGRLFVALQNGLQSGGAMTRPVKQDDS